MTDTRDIQLDELEALVVGVISQTRALRRNGQFAWQHCVAELESEVSALLQQVGRMKGAALPAPQTRGGDDWLPVATAP